MSILIFSVRGPHALMTRSNVVFVMDQLRGAQKDMTNFVVISSHHQPNVLDIGIREKGCESKRSHGRDSDQLAGENRPCRPL